jgi:hypothetical protein
MLHTRFVRESGFKRKDIYAEKVLGGSHGHISGSHHRRRDVRGRDSTRGRSAVTSLQA